MTDSLLSRLSQAEPTDDEVEVRAAARAWNAFWANVSDDDMFAKSCDEDSDAMRDALKAAYAIHDKPRVEAEKRLRAIGAVPKASPRKAISSDYAAGYNHALETVAAIINAPCSEETTE